MILPPVDILIFIIWAGFFACWWIPAFRNRTPVKRQTSRSGFLATMVLPAAAIMVAVSLFAPDFSTARVLPDILPVVITGLLVLLLGIGLAVWARVHLGTNWSSRPAIHENHTITRTGPYAIVRHPIYTGLLTGILGTAIATGALLAFVSLGVMVVLFFLKIRMEEEFLLEEFGDEYERYRGEVRALVPWVL